MRLPWTLLAATLALVALPTPASASTANVTLAVDANLTFPYDEPAWSASCGMDAPVGTDGGALLDLAVAAGCIDGWSHADFGFGRYVTSITGPGAADATQERAPECPGTIGYWGLWVNGAQASVGIDDYEAAAGDEVLFHYTVDDGCTFALTIATFFTGTRVASPLPLSGPL